MSTTSNGLILTPASETAMTFLEWRTLMNGTSGSNMQVIDDFLSEMAYIDKTEEQHAQQLGPVQYLLTLGDGKYKIGQDYLGDVYYAVTETVSNVKYTTIIEKCNDSTVNEFLYIGNTLASSCEISASGRSYSTKLSVSETPTGQYDVANKSYVDQTVAGEAKVVYYNGDVPSYAGSNTSASISSFYPTPRAGDTVIGKNGAIGYVGAISSNTTVHFSGTGMMLAAPRDVTREFRRSEFTDPIDYLLALGPGDYILLYDSEIHYTAKCTWIYGENDDNVKFVEVSQYYGDAQAQISELEKRIYINGQNAFCVNYNSSGAQYMNRFNVLYPQYQDNPATKGYVDDLLETRKNFAYYKNTISLTQGTQTASAEYFYPSVSAGDYFVDDSGRICVVRTVSSGTVTFEYCGFQIFNALTMRNGCTVQGIKLANYPYEDGVEMSAWYLINTPILFLGGSRSDEPVVVRNVSAPVNNTDAANKAYVDALEARVAALEALHT